MTNLNLFSYGKMSDFCFASIVRVHFGHKTAKFWKVVERLWYFKIKTNITSYLNISHENMSDFVSFSLFGFTFFLKVRNLDFDTHWNTLFFDKKTMSDLNMSCQAMSDLDYASFFVLNFDNKLRNTNFKLYWNSLIFLN